MLTIDEEAIDEEEHRIMAFMDKAIALIESLRPGIIASDREADLPHSPLPRLGKSEVKKMLGYTRSPVFLPYRDGKLPAVACPCMS